MNEILHANIFFFITSIAVIVLAILAAIALYYLVGILRNLRDISNRARRGSEVLEHDLENLRESIHQEGVRFRNIRKFIKGYTKWFPSDDEKGHKKDR